MKESKTAIRYAKAALNLAIDLNKGREVNDDMKLITKTIDENQDLQWMIHNPVIKNSVKKEVLTSIFKDKIEPTSLSLISLLIENKRLKMLDDVAKEYTFIYDRHRGTQIAQVTSAIPLSDELKDKILAKLKDLVGKEVSIENTIDPSIIGGFILRIGDQQYDASITGKMNNLRRAFDSQAAVSN
ncbi:ATP synthase F1 subunit delta [Flavobacteriaceae bacterium F08102]|nr:ATP synthase F1 subunit delta [Flavobacteriaceae bacterium F08102]